MSRIRTAFIIVIGLTAPLWVARAGAPRAAASDTEGALRTLVTGYSNHGQPLIPSLLEIASIYRLPMGIERVTPEALSRSVHVEPQKRTDLSSVLNLLVGQIPGYKWSVREGAVDVYGDAATNRLNLFNYVVPRLEVRGGDLNAVNALLRMSVPDRAVPVYRKPEAPPPGKVYSVFGDSPGIAGLESPRIDFEAHQETVRSILNRIVARAGGQLIWISRVPPNELSHRPNKGLWQLWRPSPWSDVISALDPSLRSHLQSADTIETPSR